MMGKILHSDQKIVQYWEENNRNISKVSRDLNIGYKRIYRVLMEHDLILGDREAKAKIQRKKERDDFVIQSYRKHKSLRGTARETGITRDTIKRILEKHNIEKLVPEQTISNQKLDLDMPKIIERYLKGESTNQIAASLNLSPERIRRRLRTEGVAMRKGGFSYNKGSTKRSYAESRISYTVAAACLGRRLREGEAIHHHDGNPSNNHPRNLWYFPTTHLHDLYHSRLSYYQQKDDEVLSIDDLAREIGGQPLLEFPYPIESLFYRDDQSLLRMRE